MLPREVELVFFLSQIFAPKSEAVAGRKVDVVDVGQSFPRQSARCVPLSFCFETLAAKSDSEERVPNIHPRPSFVHL